MTRSVRSRGRGLFWCLLAALPLTVSCTRNEGPVVPPELAARCVVVGDVDSGAGWSAWFAEFMPASPVWPWSRLDEALALARAEDRLLVVAGGPVPASAQESLGDHLLTGGRLLGLGLVHPLEGTGSAEVRYAIGLHQPVVAITGSVLRVDGMDARKNLAKRPMRGAHPGPSGRGGEEAGDERWVPVLEAVLADDSVSACPGSFWLTPQAHGRHAVAGWIGFDAGREEGKALLPVVQSMLARMTRDVYLYRFGLPRFSVTARESQVASARLIDRRLREAAPVRIAVEWVNQNGQEVRRHVTPPIDALTGQASINIGLAPNPSGDSERYTLRFEVRDRTDQRTLDSADQPLAVFAAEAATTMDPIVVTSGQLMQGRRPVFMLGVNYRPRFSVPSMGEGKHWLSPSHFDPATVEADLDLMASIGINAVAFEFTDVQQAPQVRCVLDALRRRSMWACLYLPALNPLDLRQEEARVLLQAIRLEQWPEVFAIEVARGFPVLSRAERRRLDASWREWVEEHFSSIEEAELKLGISLWRERGRLVGPADAELRRGPKDTSVALYYCFLRDLASRRLGYIRRFLRDEGYGALITARSAYGWPGDPPPGVLDTLDLSTGALHLDFLFPDAWSIHPLRSMPRDGEILAAYARGVAAGKPVLWSAYGQQVGRQPDAAAEQRQNEVYAHLLNLFIRQEASGAFAWWFPSGVSDAVPQDWGLVRPPGTWRPVEEALRSARLQIRQLRIQPRPAVRKAGPVILSASQWNQWQAERTGLFADSAELAEINQWTLPGIGSDTRDLLDPRFRSRWSDTDAFTLLNAEWGAASIGEGKYQREPGSQVRTYTGRALKLEILNAGTVKWIGAADRVNGSVWLRISQPGQQEEWIALGHLERGDRHTVTWTPREPGLWELQAHLVGYGKFGERLLLDVSGPPRLF